MEETNQPKNQIVTVQLHQIEWPCVLNECFSVEILNWLIMDSLSSSTLQTAAKKRIHIMTKPRTKKDSYWVTGGFLYYLHLLDVGWDKKIECVMDWDADSKKIKQYFSDDLHFSLFLAKGGSVSAAAKAAILISLNELAVNNQYPLGVQAPYNMIKKRNQALLKELVGFDTRSYNRADKLGIPPRVREQIESILELPQSAIKKMVPEDVSRFREHNE